MLLKQVMKYQGYKFRFSSIEVFIFEQQFQLPSTKIYFCFKERLFFHLSRLYIYQGNFSIQNFLCSVKFYLLFLFYQGYLLRFSSIRDEQAPRAEISSQGYLL